MTRVYYGTHVGSDRYGVRPGLGECIAPGTPVRVAWGRWEGRLGRVTGYVSKGAGGHGKMRSFARVDLAPYGRAKARTVFVLGFTLLDDHNAERAAHGLPPEELPS